MRTVHTGSYAPDNNNNLTYNNLIKVILVTDVVWFGLRNDPFNNLTNLATLTTRLVVNA